MEFPDSKIKQLVRSYKSGSRNCLTAIVEILSLWILNYPIRVFYVNEDDAMDFYEYIFKRLPGIIEKYRITNAKFKTYFFIVLRNHFRNWLRLNKRYYEESYIEDLPEFVSDKINSYGAESTTSSKLKPELKNIIKNLPLKERTVIKLLFFESTGKDLIKIAKMRETEVKKIVGYYNQSLEVSAKRRIRLNDLKAEINKNRYSIKKLEKRLNIATDRKDELELENKINLKKKKIENLRKNIQILIPNLDYESVSRITGFDTKEVARLLYRAKNHIEKEMIKNEKFNRM